jgi:hypothetical protein
MKSSALVQTLLLGAALALPASALAQDGESNFSTTQCTVEEVATFANRVHVKCKDRAISFFASPTSNAGESTRLVTLGSAALLGAGDLEITFEVFSLDNAESFGCLRGNCRRPIQIRLIK